MIADYIIVGAGTAGCVIAARLAEAGFSVLLLEAGKSDRSMFIHIPAGVRYLLYHPSHNWLYASEPEPGTRDRPIHTPRGKVLGGSSSINGMIYVRGNPADFDGWAQLGCHGWSFEEVLPLFKRSERYLDDGDPDFRGREGPMPVQGYRTVLPLTHLFVRAAQEAGFSRTPDLNGRRQEGVGYAQMMRRGRFRASAYRTFLGTPSARRNVTVWPRTHVASLILRSGRCVGVRLVRAGVQEEALARREVIVAGGAINSPQLLQLSGIGDPEHLRSVGIEPVHRLDGVGRNLSDHYTARLVSELRGLVTVNELSRGWRLAREILRYGVFGDGALTFGATTAMVFCRSREGLASPDIQLLFTPASYAAGKTLVFSDRPGMTIAVCPTRPASRGSVLAANPDPFVPPRIRYGSLTSGEDVRVMIAGLRTARRIFAVPSLARHAVAELHPGGGATSDGDLEEFARREGSSLYHPVGTCKMGIDPLSVVSPELKVHGVRGLRVADASIMPFLTTGNTNAPTMMIGEKAADMIIADARSFDLR